MTYKWSFYTEPPPPLQKYGYVPLFIFQMVTISSLILYWIHDLKVTYFRTSAGVNTTQSYSAVGLGQVLGQIIQLSLIWNDRFMESNMVIYWESMFQFWRVRSNTGIPLWGWLLDFTFYRPNIRPKKKKLLYWSNMKFSNRVGRVAFFFFFFFFF